MKICPVEAELFYADIERQTRREEANTRFFAILCKKRIKTESDESLSLLFKRG
jgi:hypothetical protein